MSNAKQYAVIFDIDGTLSNTDHRAHFMEQTPKDWDAFYEHMTEDKPIPETIALAKAFYELSEASHDKVTLIFITGRPETYRGITEAWLKTHIGAENFLLLMRETGNHEPDTKLKERLFGHVAQQWHVLFAIDDRTRVVEHLNKLFGFPTIQFQKHDF